MVSNKDRLYIALYPSGVVNNDERKYHWGFLIGPKDESKGKVPGLRSHVRNHPLQGWKYEEVELEDVRSTATLLARMMIAKIEDKEQLLKILRNTPVVQNDPQFRCRTWVSDALSRISNSEPSVVGTSELCWDVIEQKARRYVERKAAAGRYSDVGRVLDPKPTWDMIKEKEVMD
ncbi:hypothetical protein MY3296_007115 [Beauveria thailandica]